MGFGRYYFYNVTVVDLCVNYRCGPADLSVLHVADLQAIGSCTIMNIMDSPVWTHVTVVRSLVDFVLRRILHHYGKYELFYINT